MNASLVAGGRVAPKSASPLRVLAITRKPHSASYEQRVVNHIEPLQQLGIEVETRYYPRGAHAGQIATIMQASQYDVVWWHRHLLPMWYMRLLRTKAKYLVYDFDDPVCFSARKEGGRSIRARRFASMVRSADAVITASHYLRELAASHNPNVSIIPMAVDLPTRRELSGPKMARELLWLGSASTQHYLELIRQALETLGRRYPDVRLRLVAHEPMVFGELNTEFVKWTPEVQQKALRECAIGLCPMPDTRWSRGKCPYKVLQYMSHEMAWVGSAVGENIVAAGSPVADEMRGLTAEDNAQWVRSVDMLLADPSRGEEMGRRARSYIEAHHERHNIARRIAAVLSMRPQSGSRRGVTRRESGGAQWMRRWRAPS